jgi:glycerol uptake facilitator-like aquaporin
MTDAFSPARRLAAEALGTALLVASVVGSGIMADMLAGGNVALALLGNTIPTGAILVVLILGLGPISGAHFNPAVSLVMGVTGALPWRDVGAYAVAQIIGGCLGTLAAHGMFDLPLFQLASTARTGPAQWFAEFVATFGLLVTILAVVRFRIEAIPCAVGLYITAAYWFTASTSFANPAVTIARPDEYLCRDRSRQRAPVRGLAGGGRAGRHGRDAMDAVA